MKVGIYISPTYPTPPTTAAILAPWLLVHDLVNLLVKRGHRVFLFAAKGSLTEGELYDFGIEPTFSKKTDLPLSAYQNLAREAEFILFRKMTEVVAREGIDVVHIHVPVEKLYLVVKMAPRTVPFVFTLHDPLTAERVAGLAKLIDLGNCYFVAISESQKRGWPLPFAGTVYNGVSLGRFEFAAEPGANASLLSVGRIVTEKGFHEAIETARRAGARLIIAGQTYLEKPAAKAYFEKEIKPRVDGAHVFLESVIRPDHLTGHYQTAKALLFPIQWEEPFGMVMVEAMACGTPVVAYNRGSVPEIVRDGLTGFIVEPDQAASYPSTPPNPLLKRGGEGELLSGGHWIIKQRGIAGLVEAVRRIGEIDRIACRKHVEENFTVEKMVEGYERVYRKVVDERLASSV